MPDILFRASHSIQLSADTKLIHRLRLGFAKYRRLHMVFDSRVQKSHCETILNGFSHRNYEGTE